MLSIHHFFRNWIRCGYFLPVNMVDMETVILAKILIALEIRRRSALWRRTTITLMNNLHEHFDFVLAPEELINLQDCVHTHHCGCYRWSTQHQHLPHYHHRPLLIINHDLSEGIPQVWSVNFMLRAFVSFYDTFSTTSKGIRLWNTDKQNNNYIFIESWLDGGSRWAKHPM